MEKVFGWKKDKYDRRDFLKKYSYKEIPSFIALTQFLPDVRDQGHVGSCVGFGIGANLAGRAKRLEVYTEWFSPTWIYNGARYLEGSLTLDIGCYPRDALHWLYMKGCLLEHFWPYDPEKLDTTSPPSHLEPEAAKNPLLSYYRVVDGVDGICEAIADLHFVSIGTPWFEKWMEAEGGALPEVTILDSVAGGHETCLYGYDKTEKVFFGINSWGDAWGDNGYFRMPFSAFDVFKLRGGYDAHYIGLEAAPEEEEESKCPWARAYINFGNVLAKLLRSDTRVKAIKGGAS